MLFSTFITVFGWEQPNTLALPQAILELPLVERTISPKILTISLSLSFFVETLISISIFKFLHSPPFLQKLLELPLVFIFSIIERMDSISLDVSRVPLAYVAVRYASMADCWRPYAAAMLFVVFPLAIVVLSIVPSELSFAISRTHFKFSFVNALFGDLCAEYLFIFNELPLKLAFLGDVYSFAMSKFGSFTTSLHLSNVKGISEPNYAKSLWFKHLLEVEHGLERLVGWDEGRQRLFCWNFYHSHWFLATF